MCVVKRKAVLVFSSAAPRECTSWRRARRREAKSRKREALLELQGTRAKKRVDMDTREREKEQGKRHTRHDESSSSTRALKADRERR
jgi:hypothetical protein